MKTKLQTGSTKAHGKSGGVWSGLLRQRRETTLHMNLFHEKGTVPRPQGAFEIQLSKI
jgi:hypothetical protein